MLLDFMMQLTFYWDSEWASKVWNFIASHPIFPPAFLCKNLGEDIRNFPKKFKQKIKNSIKILTQFSHLDFKTNRQIKPSVDAIFTFNFSITISNSIAIFITNKVEVVRKAIASIFKDNALLIELYKSNGFLMEILTFQ